MAKNSKVMPGFASALLSGWPLFVELRNPEGKGLYRIPLSACKAHNNIPSGLAFDVPELIVDESIIVDSVWLVAQKSSGWESVMQFGMTSSTAVTAGSKFNLVGMSIDIT